MAVRTPRPWLMLGGERGGSGFGERGAVSTPAYLIPLLHAERGLSLAQAGLLAAAPNVGVLLTLVLWGAAVDRWGERGGARDRARGSRRAATVGAMFAQRIRRARHRVLAIGMGSARARARRAGGS